MKTSEKLTIQLAFLSAAVLITCGQASATTVTYNFDEMGWINTAGTNENFTGSFTGTPDAVGVLTAADLTGFMATLTESNAQNATKTIATFGLPAGALGLTNFLFDPATNSLSLSDVGSPGATICLGATVAQGVCGPVGPRPVSTNGVPAPPLEGLFVSSVNGALSATSIALPTIKPGQGTLPGLGVGQVPTAGNTPEPASLVLCGSAMLLACVMVRFRRAGLRIVISKE